MRNSNYLGMIYPFFLDNSCLKDHVNRVEDTRRTPCYYYEFYSPGMNKNQTPYISLTKVSTDVAGNANIPCENDLDVLKMCSGDKKLMSRRATDFINEILFKREKFKPVAHVPEGKPTTFPFFEMDDELLTQRVLITSIRDSLRWRFYSFQAGSYVDILWDNEKHEILICEICENEERVWLEPKGMYDILDTNFEHNLIKDLDEFKKTEFKRSKYWKKDRTIRVSDINKYIKTLEWNSFLKEDQDPFGDPFEFGFGPIEEAVDEEEVAE